LDRGATYIRQAAITLGIGPHFLFVYGFSQSESEVGKISYSAMQENASGCFFSSSFCANAKVVGQMSEGFLAAK